MMLFWLQHHRVRAGASSLRYEEHLAQVADHRQVLHQDDEVRHQTGCKIH